MDEPNVVQAPAQENNNPIGVYGWRKRCLYFFILLLVVILLVNLGLTIWILVVLRFNVDGMGSLRITDAGIRVEGQSDFIGPLYADSISADESSSLLLQSNEEIDINVGGVSSLSLSSTTCSITAPLLQMLSPSTSTPSLTVDSQGVSVQAAELNVRGSLGLTLAGPLETEQVLSGPGDNLQLTSPSGRMTLTGSQGVRIEDGFGFDGIEVTSNEGVSITSRNGAITLEGQNINMPSLPRASSEGSVYEVCACSSGQLYLVPATDSCDNHNGICN